MIFDKIREQIILDLKNIGGKNIGSLITKLSHSKKLKQINNNIIQNTDYLPYDSNISESLYQIANHLYSRPICLHCQKNTVTFLSFNKGYSKYCSQRCASNSTYVKQKSIKTSLKNYGVENVSQSEFIKNKKKQKSLQKYGKSCPLQSEIVKEKIKQTNLQRLGVEYPTQSETVKEKVKQTNLQRIGVEYPLQSKVLKEKAEQTTLQRHGVKHALQSKVLKEKAERKQNKLIYKNMVNLLLFKVK